MRKIYYSIETLADKTSVVSHECQRVEKVKILKTGRNQTKNAEMLDLKGFWAHDELDTSYISKSNHHVEFNFAWQLDSTDFNFKPSC